jgi:hypothetical protein
MDFGSRFLVRIASILTSLLICFYGCGPHPSGPVIPDNIYAVMGILNCSTYYPIHIGDTLVYSCRHIRLYTSYDTSFTIIRSIDDAFSREDSLFFLRKERRYGGPDDTNYIRIDTLFIRGNNVLWYPTREDITTEAAYATIFPDSSRGVAHRIDSSVVVPWPSDTSPTRIIDSCDVFFLPSTHLTECHIYARGIGLVEYTYADHIDIFTMKLIGATTSCQ